jgi:hypothetical protein
MVEPLLIFSIPKRYSLVKRCQIFMKARSIVELPPPNPRCIGWAIVASWMPGRFHQITTFQTTGESTLPKLFGEAAPEKPVTITQIIKCNKDGISSEDDYMVPVYEREYETLDAAREGHKITLALFAAGKPLPE